MKFPPLLQNLIELFSRLPGVGPKTAERYVFDLLKQNKDYSKALARAIDQLSDSITHCKICLAVSQTNPCMICADVKRDAGLLCVVSETHEHNVIEATGLYKGYYHILNGVIDPMRGVTPEMLTINALLSRLQTDNRIKEVILALNPDTEGEVTMSYLKKLLSALNVKVTRLAQGLPTGADLEYADAHTLSKAFSNRTGV
jgi:recombination protein RecR